MKKKVLLAIVLCAALVFSLAACNTQAPTNPTNPTTPGSTTPAGPTDTPPAPEKKVEFPTKTITIYNSSSAGSPADVMARELGKSIEQLTGVSVVVENATGGGGGVMFGSVMGKATDGYTWGSFTASQITALLSGLDKDFPFDTFEFVANTQQDVYGINVLADSEWNSVEDLVAWAKANPGKLLIGGQGTGSSVHLSALKFAQLAGFEFVYMPYDGGADTARNLLGNHIHVGILGPTAAREYIEAGQIKMLALTGNERIESMPDTPTFLEEGYDVPFTQYRGIFVKAGVEPEIVQAISDLIREATLTDSFKDYMASIEAPDAYMDHETFSAFVAEDYEVVGAATRELLG